MFPSIGPSETDRPTHTALDLSGDDWQVEPLGRPGFPPVPARVPGLVHSDLLRAGLMPDPYVALNSHAFDWVAQTPWLYTRAFAVPPLPAGTRAELHTESTDYAALIKLNGAVVAEHAGVFEPLCVDITDTLRAGENLLQFLVDRAPLEPLQQGQGGDTRLVRLWKPRFSYGWDFSPRLITLGLPGRVSLRLWRDATLRDVHVRTTPEGVTARVQLEGALPGGGDVVLTLQDPSGASVGRCRVSGPEAHQTAFLPLSDAALWWPNGYGPQPLYTLHVSLRDGNGRLREEMTITTAPREVRFHREPNSTEMWAYRLRVNGQDVPIRGWNWVPVDVLYAPTAPHRLHHLLSLARASGANLIRVWGGGLPESSEFYDLCDRFGLLVWQDFPQSSSLQGDEPARDPQYLAYVQRTATAIVRGRRNHPSLAAWCGGNELGTDGWTIAMLTHPVTRALEEVVDLEDAGRHFIPTTPLGVDSWFLGDPPQHGSWCDVHGSWRYLGDPDHYRLYDRLTPVLHSEVGAPSMARLESARRWLSLPDHEFNVDSATARHHGAEWLDLTHAAALFGPLTTLERCHAALGWIAWEALRSVLERERLFLPSCAGTIIWQLNEPWSNIASPSSVSFDGYVKTPYWAALHSFRRCAIAARYRAIRHMPGDTLHLQIAHSAGRATVSWRLRSLAGGELYAGATTDPIHHLALTLPTRPDVLVFDLAADSGDQRAANQYLFTTHPDALAPLLNLPPSVLDVTYLARNQVAVSARGAPAVGVQVDLGAVPSPMADAGYLPYLAPGDQWKISFEGRGSATVSAWNCSPVTITVG